MPRKCVVRWGAVGGVLSVLAILCFIGLESASPQASESGIAGPTYEASGVPTAVDLSSLPTGGDHPRPPKPFFHHRGQATLDREKAEAELLRPGGQIQTQAARSSSQPSAGLGFDGISAQESFCNCYPPDGAVAAGPSHIVAAVNTAVKVWKKSGALLAGPVSLNNFFGGNKSCLPNVSDPYAGYDTAADRFVVEALTYDNSYNSTICIGVTVTNDPTQQWSIYAFPVTPSNDLLDFPRVAIGSNAIYLAGNQFQNGSSFLGARVYAYDKEAMYSGAIASSIFYNVVNNAAGHLADSLYPAQAVGMDGTAYFLAADNCSGCSTISLWKWSTPFGTSVFQLRGGVRVTAYSQPPSAKQPGGGRIATNDVRNLGGHWYNTNSALYGRTVYGTHAIGCNPGTGTVACLQWYQLYNLDTGTPALVQQGILASGGKYRYFPNLAVDNSGNLVLGYAYSSSTDYAGIRYSGRLAAAPLGTLGSETVLKAGRTSINGGRYGDYAGTALDPNGSTIWHFEEYARKGSLWGTWVGSVCFSGNC